MPDTLPTQKDIKRLTKDLAGIVSNPEFAKAVAELQAIPPDKRSEAFDRIASVDALRARGIKIPSTVRISPRFFEDPLTNAINPSDPGIPFWVRRDLPKDLPVTTADRNQPNIPLFPDTRLGTSALANLLQPRATDKVPGATVEGISVCVSGGYGVCVSVGYQQ